VSNVPKLKKRRIDAPFLRIEVLNAYGKFKPIRWSDGHTITQFRYKQEEKKQPVVSFSIIIEDDLPFQSYEFLKNSYVRIYVGSTNTHIRPILAVIQTVDMQFEETKTIHVTATERGANLFGENVSAEFLDKRPEDIVRAVGSGLLGLTTLVEKTPESLWEGPDGEESLKKLQIKPIDVSYGAYINELAAFCNMSWGIVYWEDRYFLWWAQTKPEVLQEGKNLILCYRTGPCNIQQARLTLDFSEDAGKPTIGQGLSPSDGFRHSAFLAADKVTENLKITPEDIAEAVAKLPDRTLYGDLTGSFTGVRDLFKDTRAHIPDDVSFLIARHKEPQPTWLDWLLGGSYGHKKTRPGFVNQVYEVLLTLPSVKEKLSDVTKTLHAGQFNTDMLTKEAPLGEMHPYLFASEYGTPYIGVDIPGNVPEGTAEALTEEQFNHAIRNTAEKTIKKAIKLHVTLVSPDFRIDYGDDLLVYGLPELWCGYWFVESCEHVYGETSELVLSATKHDPEEGDDLPAITPFDTDSAQKEPNGKEVTPRYKVNYSLIVDKSGNAFYELNRTNQETLGNIVRHEPDPRLFDLNDIKSDEGPFGAVYGDPKTFTDASMSLISEQWKQTLLGDFFSEDGNE